MSDYIKREDAYEVLTNLYHHQTETQHRALREALNVIPYTDAEPVRHGKWREYPISDGMNQCSECGVLRFGKSNYCPNCGARMDQ